MRASLLVMLHCYSASGVNVWRWAAACHQCSAYVLDEVGEQANVADIKEAEVICTGTGTGEIERKSSVQWQSDTIIHAPPPPLPLIPFPITSAVITITPQIFG